MADSFNAMHYLSLTAREALETSDDPVGEVLELNRAAYRVSRRYFLGR